jgi:hypothetical protein
MAMGQPLNVRVPADLLDELDTAAAERNWNRSEFVRWLMACGLSKDALYYVYEPPTLPNWQVESWTLLLRGVFGDERLILTTDVKALLEEAVAALDKRQRQVLELRFGLDGPRHTLQEVGAIMGWADRQRVYQVEVEALRRVRGWCRARGLWKLLKEQLDKKETR